LLKVYLTLVLVVFGAAGQDKSKGFLLDSSKPYAYIVYDHIGPRKPQRQGEDTTGLWLRIVNNCRIPIALRNFGVNTGDPGMGVLYDVIPRRPEIKIEGNAGIEIGEPAKKVKPSPPEGYSAEVASVNQIAPGENMLFSIPRNHVSRDWFVRVRVWLAVSRYREPYTEVDFLEDQIPDSYRLSQ
jgi:hypothetical protein